jgi:pyrroloquinoline quinone (PQQ) biosynthesis protein C
MFDPIGLTGEILKTARENGTSDRAYEYLRKLAEKVGVDEEKIANYEDETKYGPAVVYYP